MFQPLYVRPLATSEKEILLKCSESSNKEEATRAQIILMSADGRTAGEISQTLGYHSSNVKKWIRRFNRDGIGGIGVKKRGPQGGPRPKFTSTQIESIIRLSKTDPTTLGFSFKTWTPQKLATAAVEKGIVDRISHVTVRQVIKRADKASAYAEGVNASEWLATTDDWDLPQFRLGREALARSQYEIAADHFTAVLGGEAITAEQRAVIRVLLAQSLEELARYDEAWAALIDYEDPQSLETLSAQTRARIILRIGWVNSWRRNYPDAIASLNEAIKLFVELQDNIGISEAHYALGRTYILINEIGIARDHLLAACSYQETAGDRELLSRIYDRLGTVDFNERAFTSAREKYLKALELAEGSSNTNLLGAILVNLGTAIDEGYLGDRQEAAKYKRRAIEYFEKGGHKDYLAQTYNNLGDNLRYSGEWQEAIDCLNQAIDIAQRFAQPNYEATARITLAEILSGRGEFSESEAQLKKSLDLIEGESDKWLESNALRILAGVHRRTGRIESSLRILRNTLQLSTSIGDLQGVMLGQVALSESHYLQGGYDQAREYLELAQALLKEEKLLLISGLVQRVMGQLESAAGRIQAARRHIAQSISIFTTTEIIYELARSYYEMGTLLKKAGDYSGAEINLRQALSIYERLGAKPDLELTNIALSSVLPGATGEQVVLRVVPPNDVLLMQRLIEASASRDLLVQELATVISDNFTVSAVAVLRMEESGNLEPLALQGLSRTEAHKLCTSLDLGTREPLSRQSDGYVIRIGNGSKSGVVLFLRTSDDVDVIRLQPLIKQAELGLEACSLRATARRSTEIITDQRVRVIMPGFIVGSKPMFDVVEKIHKIRTSAVTVLITGESGTGKELVARAIHSESARARAIFLPFNCTATPKEIIDSQLFGHRRGAFTGATNNYPGIIKAADGGTLFLDEIGDLSLEVQPKLMRFLQESEIQPLGEVRPLRVDVRVLAATNTELERAVEDGRFRGDLFHRLNIIRIHVPPLRDRREEVPVLAAHFLEHFSSRSGKQGITLTEDAIEGLANYNWPGNVRQLRNEIERVIAYASEGAQISIEDLSPEVSQPRTEAAGARPRFYTQRAAANGGRPLEVRVNGTGGDKHFPAQTHVKLKEATAALERQLIEAALIRNKNNLSRTALDLGLSRRGLRLKLGQLGIQREDNY